MNNQKRDELAQNFKPKSGRSFFGDREKTLKAECFSGGFDAREEEVRRLRDALKLIEGWASHASDGRKFNGDHKLVIKQISEIASTALDENLKLQKVAGK